VKNDRRTGRSDGHADLRQLGTESLVNLPGLNLSTPRSVGGALPTPVTGKASYLSGSLAGSMLGALGPQTLLDNLPASLQPSSTLFYYSPQAEDLTLQQAALQQTGQASFVNGLSYDSKTGMSVTGQEKAILYQNAINYAEQNNLQLGDALSQTRSLRCPSRCCGMSSSLCPIRVAYRRV
jgi:filamentous hemagglutinin